LIIDNVDIKSFEKQQKSTNKFESNKLIILYNKNKLEIKELGKFRKLIESV
jgi:hypothetical protein